jgi:uncharacterized protein YwqG
VNAFWNEWRKELDRVSMPVGRKLGGGPGAPAWDEITAELQAEIRRLLEPVQRPCAQISLAGGATDPTQSYLSGHPYLPVDAGWPTGVFGPQLFVGQINFAEVPRLTGFPTVGLLQWFVEADPAFGLRDDGEADEFTVRWYDGASLLARPSAYEPDDLTPTEAVEVVPMEFVGATALTFTPALSIPGWAELPEQIRTADLWRRLGHALGRPGVDRELTYSLDVRQEPSPLKELVTTSKIGGYPTFARRDPRGCPGYDGGRELIIELDSANTGGWGDGGIAHLFGVPDELSRGQTGAIRYHWACS